MHSKSVPASIFAACLISLNLARIATAERGPTTVQSTVEALRNHQYEKALMLSEGLIDTQPRDPQAWTLKGMALAGLRRNNEALQAYHQALAADPDYTAALKAAAQLQYNLQSAEAVALLEKIVRLDPRDQTAHAMLGELAYRRKDCDAAIVHFSQSQQAISDSPIALSQFSACLFRAKRPGDAIPVLERRNQLQPGDWHSQYYLGLAQFFTHRYADAIVTIKPLTDGATPNTRALSLMAASYEAMQHTPEAVAALKRAVELAPHDINNYLDLATISLDHGAYQVGVDVLSDGLKNVPESAALYTARGVLYVQMRRFDEADADFARARRAEPGQNLSTVARGISQVEQNQLGQSLETVRARLQKVPNDPTLNYLLSEVLIRKGVRPETSEFQEALNAARRAVRAKPDFALAYDQLSVLYLRSGQTSQAMAASRLALKSDPDDIAAVYHLIMCLRKLGDDGELPQLMEKMAEMTTAARERTEAVNRYKLVEEEAGLAPGADSK